MFETLFTYPGVIRRHREGPLATERAAYLRGLAAESMAQGTILRRARYYCLCIALELQRWPPAHRFDEDEVEALAAIWESVHSTCKKFALRTLYQYLGVMWTHRSPLAR